MPIYGQGSYGKVVSSDLCNLNKQTYDDKVIKIMDSLSPDSYECDDYLYDSKEVIDRIKSANVDNVNYPEKIICIEGTNDMRMIPGMENREKYICEILPKCDEDYRMWCKRHQFNKSYIFTTLIKLMETAQKLHKEGLYNFDLRAENLMVNGTGKIMMIDVLDLSVYDYESLYSKILLLSDNFYIWPPEVAALIDINKKSGHSKKCKRATEKFIEKVFGSFNKFAEKVIVYELGMLLKLSGFKEDFIEKNLLCPVGKRFNLIETIECMKKTKYIKR